MISRGMQITIFMCFNCVACGASPPAARVVPSIETLARCERKFSRRQSDSLPDSILIGRYELRMISEDRYYKGRSVTGQLELHYTDSAYKTRIDAARADPHRDPEMNFRSFYEPIIGTVTIDLQRIYAVPSGNLGSLDPSEPGVYLMQSQPVLDFGRFPMALDGTSLSLRIVGRSALGFWGSWSSAWSLSRSTVTGRFCAKRIQS